MKTRLRITFVCIVLSNFAALSTVEAALLDWQFNDANGTGLTALTQSGTFADGFETNITGITANGSGGLVINNNGTSTANSWLDGTIGLTSGIYQVDALISSYDLTNLTGGAVNGTGSGLYMGFTSGDGSTTVTADFNLTGNGTNVFLQGRTAPGSLAQQGSATLGLTGTDLAIRLTVDFDTANAQLLYSAGNTGIYTSVFTAGIGTRVGTDFRLRQSADLSASTDNIVLDSLTVTAIPEPGTFALIALTGIALGIGYRRKRA